jgi:hypothetical protein
MFPRESLDPRVGDHVLRIVNPEKTQTKIACVKDDGRQNTDQNNEGI